MSLSRISRRALRMFLPVVLLAYLVPLATPGIAAGETVGTLWVDAVNGSDTNPGTQAEPLKTLTRAFARSGPDDTIVVEPGTYDRGNGETFPLDDNGASVIGAQGSAVTIVHGDGTHGVLTGRAFTSGDTISGLTFTGGGVDAGAGVHIQFDTDTGVASPLIQYNVFEDNSSTYSGGALMLLATGPGSFEPLVQGNTFRRNTADQGGAVAVVGGVSATFLGNVFEDNSAYSAGALLALNSDSTVTIDHNEFAGNEATGAIAGAIYVRATGDQTQSITGNTFTDNTAAYDGGALALSSGNVAVSGNRARGNAAAGFGGFARIGFAVVQARNNAIVASAAQAGGAAWYVTNGTLLERNDTVLDGSDSPSAATGDPQATIDIANSIYWNPALGLDIERADSVSYTCVSDPLVADPSRGNAIGAGITGDDPLFAQAGSGAVALATGSPCIDTADPALAPDTDLFGTRRPQDGDADGIALPDMGCFEWGLAAPPKIPMPFAPPLPPEEPVVPEEPIVPDSPLSGGDRYETAVRIAFETYESCDVAILASGRDFPDALAAAGLAGSYNAPLLLTDTLELPDVTRDALATLGVSDVFVVGGPAAVSAKVYAELGSTYEATRLSGADRYETAAAIAEKIASHEGPAFSGHAFVARGDRFPDALAISPLAFGARTPVLLTRPDSLPGATADALADLDIASATVAGGTSAVSIATQSQIDALVTANGGAPSDRWSGEDRYATAARIAAHGVDAGYASLACVGVATGEDYPDALSGGVRMGHEGGVMLLTQTAALSAETQAVLNEHALEIETLDVFGGIVAVSTAARTSIENALLP